MTDRLVGRSVARPNARRLLAGRGRYVGDKTFPRECHAAFVRSPHAHARILSVDCAAARASPGVIAVYTGDDLRDRLTRWIGVLTHMAGMRSPPQPALASGTAHWQGEPLVMIVAESRALAEDAAALVVIEFEPLPAVTDMDAALAPDAPVIHAELGSNLCWERRIDAGAVDAGLNANGNVTVAREFRFGRHTGVTLEPRIIICDFDPSEERLTVHHSGQVPHMMQAVMAKHLGLRESQVRVIAEDVGGSFGIKIHVYGDEMAVAAAACMLGRPVRFTADRLESFQSDIHAREHRVKAAATVDANGKLQAVAVDDMTGIGPYSVYPRSSAVEGNQVLNLVGAPYLLPAYRGRLRIAFQNKVPTCQYRAVGHPIAMAVMEGLLDDLAAQTGRDPLELRALNLRPDDSYPAKSPQGLLFADLSHQACLSKLQSLMDYESLRRDQAELRTKGVFRGIGVVMMVEITNPSPAFYGVGGAPIAAQDGAVIRLDADGRAHLASSVTEQGQGTDTILAQIAADELGLGVADIVVATGDTAHVPYGGGTWASRGAGIGGEAVRKAAALLAERIRGVAAGILQVSPGELSLRGSGIVDPSGAERLSLRDLARIVYYRGNELPAGQPSELIASSHYRVEGFPFVFTNGAMASHAEVDVETGFVKLLGHWVVEDVGTIINPKLVDEQIRGGVVQGIGGALYEECLYSTDGQLLNASMADYLVPMAGEMPDITIAHVVTPSRTSVLGAKGAGEAGTAGAPGAVMNAVNDAIRPLGAQISQMPMTPERILRALKAV